MLPILRQRLLIVAAALVGGLVWMWIAPWLGPVSGYEGIALYDASVGLAGAVGLLLALGLPAIGLGLLTSVTGHPLSGLFVVATALCLLAGAGGSSEGWLWRADLPGGYGWLIGETLVFSAMLVGLLGLIELVRPRLARPLAKLSTRDHFGRGTRLWARPGGRDLLAGLITAAGGMLLVNLLVRSADEGQVLGALVLGFLVAGLLGQALSPAKNPVCMLLAPAAAGVAGYAWVLGHYDSGEAVRDAWYAGELAGLALVLPIHYFAGGLVGVTLGIGLGQSIEHGSRERRSQET
ncbi:MAG: hypothetical protein ACLFV3_09510 [Phycisphaeraceae bacterium]